MEKLRCTILLFACLAFGAGDSIFETQEAFALEASKKRPAGASAVVGTASSSSLSTRAWKDLNEKNYRAALKSAEQWLSREPKAASAYYVKGKAYAGLGDKDRAIAALNQAIKLDPKMSIAYGERGWQLYFKGRYKEAEGDFSTLIVLNPAAASYTSRAYANSKMNRTRAVIADATKSIELNPRDVQAYELRANALFQTGPYDDCIEDWRKAIALAPKNERLRRGLGLVLAKSTQHEMVAEEMTKAIDSGLKGQELYQLRADAFYKLEKYQQCADDLTLLLTKFGPVEKWTSWDYYKLRGRCYLRNKQYAKAEKDFTEALTIAPDDSKSYFSRADVRERMGKYKEAIQDLTRTIKWDPNNGRAFSMRAKIYEHLGETARAASDRKAAVKLGEKQWGI